MWLLALSPFGLLQVSNQLSFPPSFSLDDAPSAAAAIGHSLPERDDGTIGWQPKKGSK